MEPVDVPFEIVVKEPLPGVLASLQTGQGSKSQIVGAVRTTEADLVLSLTLRLAEGKDGAARWRGPFAQNDSRGDFVYVRWGRSAGDPLTEWNRRAKLYLAGVDPDAARRAAASGKAVRLEIAGRARDGGPACPTVPVTVVMPD